MNYTSCELTNQSDKTLAIWSVAKLVRDHLTIEDQYGCGLRATVLHEQLAWRVRTTKTGARMDTLQAAFPSWSWASVNAPIQVRERLVEKRSYIIKSHGGEMVTFSDFVGAAAERDMQPQFAAADALAICGHLIPVRLSHSQTDGIWKTEYSAVTSQERSSCLEVTLDEEPTKAFLAAGQFYFLPFAIAARKPERESTYFGTGLVLVTNNDFRQLTRSKLRKRIVELANLYRPRVRRDKDKADRDWEVRTLRECIQALNSWMYQVARWDKDIPARANMVYRRIGVVEFKDLPAEVWDEFRSTGEQCFWLD
ncbi:hypothetical protein E8E11_000481 [Didymella keratinophila]|nr:hypothetical protein E8E11_000481 [Didymella keratinophila]